MTNSAITTVVLQEGVDLTRSVSKGFQKQDLYAFK